MKFNKWMLLLTGLLLSVAIGALSEAQAASEFFETARGNFMTVGKLWSSKSFSMLPSSVTCAADGTGAAAACTLTPTSSLVLYTCSDTDSCAITLSEGYVDSGQELKVVNVGSNLITFADSAGVQELVSSYSAGITESISFSYSGSAWIEVGRSKVLGAAGAMVVGSSTTPSVTVTTDGTGTGEVVLPADSISAGEITDITRSVNLPIAAWVPCTGQGIWTVDGANTAPNLTAVNTGLAITYDATGGSVDTGTICAAFLVPDDYVSGGAVVARITQGGATVTQVETWSCDLSLDGAALVGANAANLTNQTAVQTATSTPTVTYVAGKSVALVCKQGNGSADDAINIHGVRWTYTATE